MVLHIAIKVEQSKAKKGSESLEDLKDQHYWDEYQYRSYALERSKLGPMMGQLPLPPDGGHPTPWDLRHSPKRGRARIAGGNKLVVHVTFENVSRGAPVFVEWLRQRGCSNFKYEFSSSGFYGYD